MATCRKVAPAARNYAAARPTADVGAAGERGPLLDLTDLKWELCRFGKLQIRHGKGRGAPGPRKRMVPLINDAKRSVAQRVLQFEVVILDTWRVPRNSSNSINNQGSSAAPTSATEIAYSGLRSLILEGRYPLGAKLRETDLAELLGVSRTPAREALSRLSSEGLVEVLPNRGARVATWSSHDLENIYEMRALVESHAAGRAAQTVQPADLDKLSTLCEAEEAEVLCPEPRLDVIRDLNREFHSALVRAVPNDRLQEIVISLVEFPSTLLSPNASSGVLMQSRLQRNLADHLDLVGALRAKDSAWAGAVMRSHMLGERATLLRERQRREGSLAANVAPEAIVEGAQASADSVIRRPAGRSAG